MDFGLEIMLGSCLHHTQHISLWCLTDSSSSVPGLSPEILRIHFSCRLFVCLFYLDTTPPRAVSRWDPKQRDVI